jgi:hypothetical protein
MFQDWHKKIKANSQISTHLLWEYDLSHFDWNEMRTLVVQRVIERGRPEDFYAIFSLYGGIKGVREIIKTIPVISSPKDVSFVCSVFNLKKEELKCYTRKQLREKL